MLLSLSEVIKKTAALNSVAEKVEWLQKNTSEPLKQILKYTYDKNVEFLIPNTPPPWKKNAYIGVEGMLYKEARRLKIFIKGGGYDDLNQVKRESLFISLLEDINNDDADLLANYMICKKSFPGITRNIIEKAFPNLLG